MGTVISTNEVLKFRLHHYQTWDPVTKKVSQFELFRVTKRDNAEVSYEVVSRYGEYSYTEKFEVGLEIAEVIPFEKQDDAERHFMAMLNTKVTR